MGKYKTKAIQADLGMFMHNQAYSGIIQAYTDAQRTLCNPGTFRTLALSKLAACSEPWYIQNPNPGLFRNPVYPEPWLIQNQRHIQNPGYIQN